MDPRSLFVFDIETVPDREHHAGEGFPKPLFHRVVAIAFLGAEIEPDSGHELYHLREVRCGGEAGYGEEDLIRAFFSYFERLRPRLVSFNGRSFDLPVLKYRALVHGVSAPWLREGNYGYRYSLDRHCDLMEALPDFGATTRRKLDEVCAVLGLPGKLGIDGSMVEQLHDAGRTEEIRNCCELDVLNTYLVYLRYAVFTGWLTAEAHDRAVGDLVTYLAAERGVRPHLGEFVGTWGEAAGQRFKSFSWH
jgi:predicted PolB exonuclease-like 3'-5' exonuclease